MPFDVRIKNIGKLEDAKICIDRFTVLAGPNNSGKSFLSKTAHSVVSALNHNIVNNYFMGLINDISSDLQRIDSEFHYRTADREGNPQIDIFEFIQQLEEYVVNNQFRSTTQIENTASYFVNQIDKFIDQCESIEAPIIDYKKRLKSGIRQIESIRNRIAKQSAHEIIEQAQSEELERKFTSNFQIPKVSHIQKNQDDPLIINIDKIGRFEYLNGQFKSKILNSWPASSHGFSTIVYLESPIYLKLIKALDHPSFYFPYRLGRRGRTRISGVPGYFFDLADMLKFDYVGEVAFPDLYEKLTNGEIMGGRLIVSDDGTISYQENGRHYSMPITATGVANIGMLALLIERKILDKDSLLFVDEPEAHLHPGWQVVIAESLFELARLGVHVVIATHSLEILKWLEVHIKKNPEDKEFVALNQFPVLGPSLLDGSEQDDFENKLSNIKQELSRPFADLYVDSL